MDDQGRIYRALEEHIPAEDKARLDGYLRGKAEEHQLIAAEDLAALKAEVEEKVRDACVHDSTRVDGTLDCNCLKCGADGYWHNGHRHDQDHPSGKVLVVLGCPDQSEDRTS